MGGMTCIFIVWYCLGVIDVLRATLPVLPGVVAERLDHVPPGEVHGRDGLARPRLRLLVRPRQQFGVRGQATLVPRN